MAPTTGPASVITACPGCGTRNRIPTVASGAPHCGSCHVALPWLVDATDTDFAEIAGRAPVPVLVDLWAQWCAPCRTVAPAVEEAAAERAGSLKAVRVDVDRSPEVAARFDARSIPTLLLLRDGQVVARQVGALGAHALRRWLQHHLG
ncbi:MAG: thioredoxin [Pseudonocardia sp.]|uniref:thioredoxin n=1 Tax=unclassified Pseudonocardia TaxID=2619320 RepID=UPI000868FE6D|nr:MULTISPECIES: thioredoxin [unclassified Pseudonocardia]MBN9110810.1 thioredoxin [Pseudonocardia sp.]ODU26881.1 MAG: thioredoxin [Pseudonocardia sp. SCN 72-51]ODV05396.1 MAG: thioredoxin [Pseudonocardia sp. SCN 73-27]